MVRNRKGQVTVEEKEGSYKMTGKTDDVISRRSFFRRTICRVVPLLVLPGLPALDIVAVTSARRCSDCKSTCTNTCKATCMRGCMHTCNRACGDSCGGCKGSCNDTCKTMCGKGDSCGGTCTHACRESCRGSARDVTTSDTLVVDTLGI